MLSLEHLQFLNPELEDRRERKDKSDTGKKFHQLKITFQGLQSWQVKSQAASAACYKPAV